MASRLSISPARSEIWNYLAPAYRADLASDVLAGMTAEQRYIPSKYFYDHRGSQLFEEICRLPEYYQTRLELSILRRACGALMETFEEVDLVELGPGANPKISLLIDAAVEPGGKGIRYIPVDVSESALATTTEGLLRRYPQLADPWDRGRFHPRYRAHSPREEETHHIFREHHRKLHSLCGAPYTRECGCRDGGGRPFPRRAGSDKTGPGA